MSIIEFKNVSKSFDSLVVLDGLSFQVEKGEILAIVGPSGTGKSVTLKHIVGLLDPDEGEVTVSGKPRIGYLFQSGALLAWMTVYENVALPLKETTKLKDKEIEELVMAALHEVGLEDAADKYPGEISGGMQKRAGLARAIVRRADVVLYDEPTSGLDPVTTLTIHKLIRKLNRDHGITSIVVTHDIQGAIHLADRIMLIKDGKAVETSKVEDFVQSANPVVQEFLEAMKGELK
ncbi:MAG: ATP-binding cassette domain-containing protein [Kiritimatiellae bacterium]|nr:ATP-binding cassette domain-containing protein [Kiritimatiellia bacterium]